MIIIFYFGSKRQLSAVSGQLGGIVRSCKRLKKCVGMELSASQNTSQSQMYAINVVCRPFMLLLSSPMILIKIPHRTSCDDSPIIIQARPRKRSQRQTSMGTVSHSVVIANTKRKLPITPAMTARTIETPAIISVTPQAIGASPSSGEKGSISQSFPATTETISRKKTKSARGIRAVTGVSSKVIVDITTSGKNVASAKHVKRKRSLNNTNASGVNVTRVKHKKLKRSLGSIDDSDKNFASVKHAKSKHSLENRDVEMGAQAVSEIGAQAVSEAPATMKKIARHKRTISVTTDAVCDVCFDGDSEANNQILFCDGCNVAVHQACYGVPAVPSGHWYCDWCSVNTGIRPNRECAVCPNEGGALKRCYTSQASKNRRHRRNDKSRSWVHACCTVWMPELHYKDENKRRVLGLDKMNKKRWNRRCVICKEESGASIQCASTDPYCAKWFHPYCAIKANLHGKPSRGDCLKIIDVLIDTNLNALEPVRNAILTIPAAHHVIPTNIHNHSTHRFSSEIVENNSSQGFKLLAYCPIHGRAQENEQNIQVLSTS